MLDYLKSIFENIQSRVSSPFLGAFTISFLVYNWKPVYILLFSDRRTIDVLRFVEETYTSYWVLLGPFLMATGYILFVPWINYLVLNIQKPVQLKYYKYRHEDEINRLDKSIEIAEKEFKISQVRSGKNEIDALINQIESKDKLIEASEKQMGILSNQYAELNKNSLEQIELISEELEVYKTQASDLKEEILRFKARSNAVISAEQVLSNLDTKQKNYILSLMTGYKNIPFDEYFVKSREYKLEALEEKELIRTENLGNVIKVSLTDIGVVSIHRYITN